MKFKMWHLVLVGCIVLIVIGMLITEKTYQDNNLDERDENNSVMNAENVISYDSKNGEQIKEENVSEEDTTEKIKEETKKENSNVVELSKDNALVQVLYNYIADFNYYEEVLVYQNKKVTEKDLTNQLKLLTVFYVLDSKQDFIDPITYSAKVVEDEAKKIFGPDVKITHENASPHDGYSRIYDSANKVYNCGSYEGGGGVPWESSIRALVKVEEDTANDKIYIYDQYVHIVDVEKVINGVSDYGYVDIYSTTDREEKIGDSINLEEKGFYERVDALSAEDDYNRKKIQILNEYTNGKVLTFKHTFQKVESGDYYWYSTEIVDKAE